MTTFGDLVRERLPEMRARAESRMTSRCTVTLPGEPTWDDETGTYTPGVPRTLYSGPCRLRLPYSYPQNADAGDSAWAVGRGTLSLPISDPTSATVVDGALVTITANPNDPAMVGLEMTVLSGHFQTDSTARRLPVQIVSRDAS